MRGKGLRLPRPAAPVVLAILCLLAASAVLAAGYTIHLRDGSHLVAKEKYTIKGNRALITLLNGTQTFIPANQIDVRRTEEANRDGYGSAVVIPGAPQDVTPPPANPRKERSLADLINTRSAGPRDLPENRRESPAAGTPAGRLTRTKAGYDDLMTFPRKPYRQAEIAAALQQFFRGQGLEEVELHEGTQASRPFIEVSTNSEGSVFKALGTAANALLHIRETYPDKVSAIELLMTTPSRERAGQFVITPAQAEELAAKKVDVTAFFVQNVQF